MVDPDSLRIDAGRLRSDLGALAQFGRSSTGGVHRRAYSAAFENACLWLADRMGQAGLEVTRDSVGNLIGRIGPPGPAVVCGSHIDSVPDGGPLDGALGVLAGLECARVLRTAQDSYGLARGLEVCAFADEEGAYASFLGSRAMTGQIGLDELDSAVSTDGTTLAKAMSGAGLDVGMVGEAKRPRDAFYAYVELHIEQGPVLEQAQVPIGIVDAICAIAHTDFVFSGQADHAGTTPMRLRRDALRGAAEFMTRAYAAMDSARRSDIRQTFGVIHASPQATNVVPFEARLTQEVRDTREDNLDALLKATRGLAEEIAQAQNLQLDCNELSRTSAAEMSPRVRSVIAEACQGLGLVCRNMSSGAGHDAQIFASVCDAGMIFVPSQGGRSHRADESTAWTDIEQGANVLLHTLRSLVYQ